MKKVLFALSICFAAATIASCNKEETKQTVPSQDFTFEASFETPQDVNKDDKTKVSFEQDAQHTLTPKWEVGDVLIGTINDAKVTFSVIYVDDNIPEQTFARLSITDYDGEALKSGDVISLIYAPGIKDYDNLDPKTKEITVDLSNMAEGTPKGLNAIMYSKITINQKDLDDHIITFKFTNKTAILEIDEISGLNYSNTTVSKVVVSGNGAFNRVSVNLANGELTGLTKGEITCVPAEPITIQDGKITGKKFFAVILPGERQIDVCAAGDKNYFRSSIKSNTYSASKCYYTKRASNPASFTVNSNGKKVIMAPGNLVYTHGTPGIWDFAGSQTFSLGRSSGNMKIGTSAFASGDKVDLFSWSTNSNKLGLQVLKMYFNVGTEFYDWGKDLTYYADDYWYTLTWDEWDYLLKNHSNEVINEGTDAYLGISDSYIVVAPDGVTETLPSKVADCIAKGLLVLPHSGLRTLGATTSSVVVEATNEAVYHSASYGGTVGSGSTTHYCDFQVNSSKTGYKHQGSGADGIAVRLAHAL